MRMVIHKVFLVEETVNVMSQRSVLAPIVFLNFLYMICQTVCIVIEICFQLMPMQGLVF